jgi:hypothetical protein
VIALVASLLAALTGGQRLVSSNGSEGAQQRPNGKLAALAQYLLS